MNSSTPPFHRPVPVLEEVAARAGAPDVEAWMKRWTPCKHHIAAPVNVPLELEDGELATLLVRISNSWRAFLVSGGRLANVTTSAQVSRDQQIKIQIMVSASKAKGVVAAMNRSFPKGAWMVATGKVSFFGEDLLGRSKASLSLKDSFRPPMSSARIARAVREGARMVAPVYPLTGGLQQHQVRQAVADYLYEHAPETDLPEALEKRLSQWMPGMPSYREALAQLHGFLPVPADQVERFAQGRSLAHLRLAAESVWDLVRKEVEEARSGGRRAEALDLNDEDTLESLVALPPFQLTGGQRQAIQEILVGLGSTDPMRRLLQGDVGSGKSVVAYLSVLAAMMKGRQAALLAPTKVLAQQLHQGMREAARWAGMESSVMFLCGDSSARERRELEKRAAEGRPLAVVGTHAVATIPFQKLGLVIVDEEQRFGLEVKNRLLERGGHCLLMSATPIPRSLACAVHGEGNVSVITEKPPGRKPVRTVLVETGEEKKRMVDDMRQAFAEGRQAFVVCPSIGSDEMMSVNRVADGLKKLFGEESVAVVHGDMKPADSERMMRRFVQGKVPCLVATSVIEVGVNVPNASIMVITDPHRFGLSQLHQIRGRVGRGEHEGVCYLSPLHPLPEKSRSRLDFFASTDDGFRIAEYDLEERGAGDLRNAEQSGRGGINYLQHGEMIRIARDYARNAYVQHAVLAGDMDPGCGL